MTPIQTGFLAGYKQAESSKWIGFDLDGTLAEYDGWKGIEHIGDPIKSTVYKLKQHLENGDTVKIMTARASGKDGEAAAKVIKEWCKEHIGQELDVTCEKDQDMLKLYDDKAEHVPENEGAPGEGEHLISFIAKGDAAGGMAKMLEDIRHRGAPGHSFSIILDPDVPRGEQGRWGFDGDGPDRIRSICCDGVPLEFEHTDKSVKITNKDAFNQLPRLTDKKASCIGFLAGYFSEKIAGATTAGEVAEAAKAADTAPTPAAIEANNYRKGHVWIQGMHISIENAKGSTRSGTDPDGNDWEVTMPAHYGYIKRTLGSDGDHVDVYVGSYPKSDRVFVVDQLDANTGKFDEHKIMLGFRDAAAAKATYLKGFSDGKGKDRLGKMTEVAMPVFKAWVKSRGTRRPFAWKPGT